MRVFVNPPKQPCWPCWGRERESKRGQHRLPAPLALRTRCADTLNATGTIRGLQNSKPACVTRTHPHTLGCTRTQDKKEGGHHMQIFGGGGVTHCTHQPHPTHHLSGRRGGKMHPLKACHCRWRPGPISFEPSHQTDRQRHNSSWNSRLHAACAAALVVNRPAAFADSLRAISAAAVGALLLLLLLPR